MLHYLSIFSDPSAGDLGTVPVPWCVRAWRQRDVGKDQAAGDRQEASPQERKLLCLL